MTVEPAPWTLAAGSGPTVEPRDSRSAEGGAWAAARFTSLYRQHHRPCLVLARRLIGDEQLAHEVVQEVFLALWRTGGAGYHPHRGEFSTWLMSVTHHKAIDAIRASERRRRQQAVAEAEHLPAAPEHPTDDTVWLELGKQQLVAALRSLTPRQREVLCLAYLAGLTQTEIANRTGIPLGTVKTRTRAGLLRLRADIARTWTPTGTHAGAPDRPAAAPSASRSG